MDPKDLPRTKWTEIMRTHGDACASLVETSADTCSNARQLVAQSHEAITQSRVLLRQSYACPRVRRSVA